MRKVFLILLLSIILIIPAFADDKVQIYSSADNTFFGLKINDETIITKPIYKKLIRLSDASWIVQHKTKYGIINDKGEYLIQPKYRHAERLFSKYAKLGNSNDYGVYDENGNTIIEPEYTKIDTLFGRMFLTCKHYKYGVRDINGKELLPNEFDDIYMPNHKTMRIKYKGNWVEIEKLKDKDIVLPENAEKITINNQTFKMTHVIVNTGLWSGYSALTATDYVVKIFSSISPAYEDTVDELMLSHGTDTISIFMQLSWLPKFPVTYAQKYYRNVITPNNGPLSDIRDVLKKQMQ